MKVMITNGHLLVVIRFTDEELTFWPVLHIMIELVLGSVVPGPVPNFHSFRIFGYFSYRKPRRS